MRKIQQKFYHNFAPEMVHLLEADLLVDEVQKSPLILYCHLQYFIHITPPEYL
jgi:hypothetical protein